MVIEELFNKYNDIKQVYVVDIDYDEREKLWLYLVNKDLVLSNTVNGIIGVAIGNPYRMMPFLKHRHKFRDPILDDSNSFFENEILYVERENKKQLAFIIHSSLHTLEVNDVTNNIFETKEYNVVTNGYYEY